jgi:tripeptide aminopeptidase
MKGGVEEAQLSYIIRDHDRDKFEARKQFMREVAKRINNVYGEGSVEVELRDQYYYMREMVEPKMHIIDVAKQAIEETCGSCRIKAIRGGTDGAQLSFKGLPCPNIFAGGLNFHGRHEFLPIPSMHKAMLTIVRIAELVAV